MMMQKTNSPYEELKYLKSSGTQYLLTSYKGVYGADISLLHNAGSTQWESFFGNNPDTSIALRIYNNSSYSCYFLSYTTGGTIVSDINKMVSVSYRDINHVVTITVNGVPKTKSYDGEYSHDNPRIFDGVYQRKYIGIVYEATLYDVNIETMAHLVPRLRKADNKPGMLDLITDEFFTNVGTGEFGYEKLDGTIVNPI